MGDLVSARLFGALAAQISGPMTQALDIVSTLARDGQIDRDGLQALAHDIARTRQAGLIGQRMARLAVSDVRQPPEAVDLSMLVAQVMAERFADTRSPVTADAGARALRVVGDPALLHTLVSATACWAAELARSPLQWRVQKQPWPARALLHCEFDLARPFDGPARALEEQFGSLDALLMRYAAHVCGVEVEHRLDGQRCRIGLQFRQLVNESLDGAAVVEWDSNHGSPISLNGCQLLVLSPQRSLRMAVRQALSRHDVFVDHVASLELAEQYCDDGLPQALIFEGGFNRLKLDALQKRLAAVDPPVALVEVVSTDRPERPGDIAPRLPRSRLAEELESLVWLEMQRRPIEVGRPLERGPAASATAPAARSATQAAARPEAVGAEPADAPAR